MTWTLVEETACEVYYEYDGTDVQDYLDDLWIPTSLRDQLVKQGYEAGLEFGITCGMQMSKQND